MIIHSSFAEPKLQLWRKLGMVSWSLVLCICLLAGIGFIALYSAENGVIGPLTLHQMIRFGVGMGVLLAIAMIDIRWWRHLAYPAYAGALALLIATEFAGDIGMGARRWIDLGFMNFQPSEGAKVALILTLARYFHGSRPEDVGRPMHLVIPFMIVMIPVLLVLRQPDLGTALMLLMIGGAMFFLAGVRIWMFVAVLIMGLVSTPIAWGQMHDYQKQRIMTFVHPESDALGAGYHILQSKIALGSGGMGGKGFLKGTQSHLNFLPEKQTDFIFTLLAEEWGFAGGLTLVGLYTIVMIYGAMISIRARSPFARLLAMGLTVNLFL
ncbi:MAG: rod shape-determining protein RodA, partial [Pseudomonadota bacterium]|nr:rod shape-determining protein RodA [Pseudomonadota bacterium]